jgi:hypothetical protein
MVSSRYGRFGAELRIAARGILMMRKGWIMSATAEKWKQMPAVVRNGIIALLAGWAGHYVFYFGYIASDQPERIIYLQLGVGIGICYCVATIRKWARRLCIYFNIIMVVMYALFALAFAQGGKVSLFILSVAIAVSFAYSLYCLLKKETFWFFSPPEEDKESGAGDFPPKP